MGWIYNLFELFAMGIKESQTLLKQSTKLLVGENSILSRWWQQRHRLNEYLGLRGPEGDQDDSDDNGSSE